MALLFRSWYAAIITLQPIMGQTLIELPEALRSNLGITPVEIEDQIQRSWPSQEFIISEEMSIFRETSTECPEPKTQMGILHSEGNPSLLPTLLIFSCLLPAEAKTQQVEGDKNWVTLPGYTM